MEGETGAKALQGQGQTEFLYRWHADDCPLTTGGSEVQEFVADLTLLQFCGSLRMRECNKCTPYIFSSTKFKG